MFQRAQPELKGLPVAVLQYSDTLDGGSSAIAVGYEARALGVKRGMRGKECLAVSSDIKLVTMPHTRAKADLTMFRDASNEVMTIFAKHATVFERASIDEAFIDITANIKKMIGLPISIAQLENTFIAGADKTQKDQVVDWAEHLKMSPPYSLDYKLSLGAIYVDMIRKEVLDTTGFTCSAGIGHNKIVAKLAAGTHKPNAQTLVSPSNIPQLYETISFTKIRNFGGKLGTTIKDELGIDKASELVNFTMTDLVQRFGEKTGGWIYHIARGNDDAPVKPRSLVKQTACSKNFPKGLSQLSDITKWITDLSEELSTRLEAEKDDNKRIPTLFGLHLTLKSCGSTSIQISMAQSTARYIQAVAVRCLEKKLGKASNGQYPDTIYMMSLTSGKFIPAPEKDNIATMLKKSKIEEQASPWAHIPSNVKKEKKKGGIMKMFKPVSEAVAVSESEKSSVAETETAPSELPVANNAVCDPEGDLGCDSNAEPDLVCDPVCDSNADLGDPVVDDLVMSSQESVRSNGFFDNYKSDEPGPSEASSNIWNTLSADDQRTMLKGPVIQTNTAKCPVCNKPVLESKLSEHLDFHTALDLQREIESAFKQEDKASPKRPLQASSRSTNKKAKISNVKTKNIASFFKKG